MPSHGSRKHHSSSNSSKPSSSSRRPRKRSSAAASALELTLSDQEVETAAAEAAAAAAAAAAAIAEIDDCVKRLAKFVKKPKSSVNAASRTSFSETLKRLTESKSYIHQNCQEGWTTVKTAAPFIKAVKEIINAPSSTLADTWIVLAYDVQSETNKLLGILQSGYNPEFGMSYSSQLNAGFDGQPPIANANVFHKPHNLLHHDPAATGSVLNQGLVQSPGQMYIDPQQLGHHSAPDPNASYLTSKPWHFETIPEGSPAPASHTQHTHNSPQVNFDDFLVSD